MSSIDLSDIPNTVLEQFFSSSNNASCLGTWLGTSWTVKVVLTPTSTHSNKDVDVSNVRPTFCDLAFLYLKWFPPPLVECFLCLNIYPFKVNFPPSWLLGRGRWWACDLPWSHHHLQDLVQGRCAGLQRLRILKVSSSCVQSLPPPLTFSSQVRLPSDLLHREPLRSGAAGDDGGPLGQHPGGWSVQGPAWPS